MKMAAAQEFARTDAPSPFSSLATERPRINLLAVWASDKDGPFAEQSEVNRVQGVLYSVYNFELHFTKQTKSVNDVAVIARVALNGYAAIPVSQITSASYGQSHGGHASHSGQRNSGGVGQSAPGSTVPPGAGNGGGSPSKRPVKRGGNGDGEGNPNKKKKVSNEPQGLGQFRCIIPELRKKSAEGDCAKSFADLGAIVNHHLRKHVGHIQCPKCFIRKGTQTDMGKHERVCTRPPAKIPGEVKDYGENIRKVKSWDEFVQRVAPNGEIQYDMASNIDILVTTLVPSCICGCFLAGIHILSEPQLQEELTQPPAGDDNSHAEQAAAPPQHQIIPVGAQAQADNTTGYSVLEMVHNNSFEMFRNNSFEMLHNNPIGYSLHTPSGISYNLSTLNTIDPKCLTKSNDSGCYSDDFGGPSSQQDTEICRYHQYSEVLGEASTGGGGVRQITSGNTEVHRHQCSEVRNQTMMGGGAGRFTSGNEAPGQCLSLELFESLNSVLEAFQKCNKYPEAARQCARNIALQVPENVLQIFAEAYRDKVLEGETHVYDPPRGAKGKEGERG